MSRIKWILQFKTNEINVLGDKYNNDKHGWITAWLNMNSNLQKNIYGQENQVEVYNENSKDQVEEILKYHYF